jgi:hypothetical protein
MRLPRRTTRLPDAARATLGLARRERVLSAARLRDGQWVAATDQALVGTGWRAPWSAASHAQWYDDVGTLEVAWLDDAGERQDRSLVLDEPGLLPETVHERVTATILLSRHLPVRGRQGVSVVARRQPGSEDVEWQVVADAGVDAADPQVSARVDAAVRAMATELGLSPSPPGDHEGSAGF